jgi:hypothetical protein
LAAFTDADAAAIAASSLCLSSLAVFSLSQFCVSLHPASPQICASCRPKLALRHRNFRCWSDGNPIRWLQTTLDTPGELQLSDGPYPTTYIRLR